MDLTPYERNFVIAVLKAITQLSGLLISIEKLERRRQTWIDIIYQCDQIIKKL